MKRLLTVFGAAGLAMASLAAVNDTLISFSTPGVDTYADGTAVRDGECYALVWSADGVFEGLDVNGRPLDAADAVVLVAPVAKDGRCPDLVYQVDAARAAAFAGGQYGVYLLDTRRTDAATGEVKVGLEDGKLVFVRTSAAATAGLAATAGGAPAAAGAAGAVGGAAATVYTEIEPPVVAIKVDAAVITLTVSGMNPFADYWVQKGTDLKDVSEKVADVPADGVVALPKTDAAAFFKVKGGLPAVK